MSDQFQLEDQTTESLASGPLDDFLRYARFHERLIAGCIDIIAVTACMIIFRWLGELVWAQTYLEFEHWILIVLYVAYFGFSEGSRKQATFGKQLFSIKVSSESGKPLAVHEAVGRLAVKTLALGPVRLLWMFGSSRNQTAYDQLGNTVVYKHA